MKKLIKSLKKRLKQFICFLGRGQRILVLSDSHGGVFEYIHDNNLLLPHYINAEIIGGATAYGLNNEKSTTNAFNRFLTSLDRFKEYDTLLIQLGEVDCSFVLWFKANKESKPVKEVIPYSLSGYEKLIKALQKFNKKIIITGAILPTLKDDQEAGESAQLRNTIKTSQLERTQLILTYNEQVKLLAEKYNLPYIDISEETFNKSTNLIDDKYIRNDMIDHHQCFKSTASLWVEKLKKTL